MLATWVKTLYYLYEFEVLGSKLQIFHDSTVSQFPEETYQKASESC